ncbi:MAG: zonular occludens toxin domain-containing protein [Nitrosomonas sp.]|nr:zonular occludens toxin domain-containing protein [Nitrosomonas sp.]
MIYLHTGANGAGKTLFVLHDVRAKQIAESRPVYYHGFEPQKAIIDFGWKPFAPADWQDLPDGSICIFDECQNDFPVRGSREAVPEYINAMAQFRRKRGFDFYMITPHPMLLDIFIRRLIDTPSFHRHFKKTFAGDAVSQITWSAVNTECDKPGSSEKGGEISIRPYPKEVYTWYRSASMHTAKRRIPKQVYFLAGAALLIPTLFYFAFQKVTPKAPNTLSSATSALPGASPSKVKTAADYLAERTPRVPGLAYTAQTYDKVTEPVTAPFPAACIASASKCKCYTQQATVLAVDDRTCRSIVEKGFFVDWDTGTKKATAPIVK